jgi:hypothetical protein
MAMRDDPTAESLDFSGLIQAGDVVVCGQATAEPRSLTEALIAQASRLPPFTVSVGARPGFRMALLPRRTRALIEDVSLRGIGPEPAFRRPARRPDD